jgi:hypothetical protein
MSPGRFPMLLLLLSMLLSLVTITGCGDKNSKTDINPVAAKHPSNWLPSSHAATASINVTACTECHGADYKGGISKIACTSCHMGDQSNKHPLKWGPFSYSGHGTFVKNSGSTGCDNMYCHGPALTGSSGPSCSSCHMGGPALVHPQSWTTLKDHGLYVNSLGAESCKNSACHGPAGGGIPNVVPACRACHAQ